MPTTVDNIKLKKCEVDEVKCKYINVDGVRVWTSSVMLTNLIGSSVASDFNGCDAAWAWRSPKIYKTVEANHRYYVRWVGDSWGGAYQSMHEKMGLFGAGVSFEENGFGTKHQIVTPTSNGSLAIQADSYACTDPGTSSGVRCYAYMLVDLTEVEEAKGRQFTSAADFWSFINSIVFYDTKEFEI